MEVAESRLGDDEPVRMTAQERTVWAYLTTVVLTSGGYFAVTVSRLLSRPVAEIPWAGPMLWAIGSDTKTRARNVGRETHAVVR